MVQSVLKQHDLLFHEPIIYSIFLNSPHTSKFPMQNKNDKGTVFDYLEKRTSWSYCYISCNFQGYCVVAYILRLILWFFTYSFNIFFLQLMTKY